MSKYMSKEFLRLNEREDLDVIMSSLFSAEKIAKNTILNTCRTGDIINSIIDTNMQKPKLLPITMRKYAAYQNAINHRNSLREEALPINMRKRLLYERSKNE